MLCSRRAGAVDGGDPVERRRRIAAYGVCYDDGRVLLVRASSTTSVPGLWQIPGGGIKHGEHPAAAVVREFVEETGLAVEVVALRAVVADVRVSPDRAVAGHTDRVIYDVAVRGGALRRELSGTIDRVEWVGPDQLPGLPMMPFTAELFGLPIEPEPVQTGQLPEKVSAARREKVAAGQPAAERRPRGQRFAAYGLATDPAGRILLTLIADGYPGAGRWHLPGGGTDHGEQPAAALLRELAEESDQVGRITGLLDVSHLRNPAALGPEGYPIDWHGVRAIFRVEVDVPTEPRVTEAAGGSTAQARWFEPAEAARLPLTDVAAAALRSLRTGAAEGEPSHN